MAFDLKKILEDISTKLNLLNDHVLFHKNELNPKIIENGWFPSSITFRHKLQEGETIDNFMERCISGDYYHQIKQDYILKKYPNRQIIFQEAFELHEKGRYIASIPLFLTQIDGIIMESGLKGFFLGRNAIQKGITKDDLKYLEYLKCYLVDSGHTNPSDQVRVFFLSFYSAVIEKASELDVSNGTTKIDARSVGFFNRHGILHGNSDYLEYGSKTNALKVISLLIFVIQTLDILDWNKKI